MDVFDYGVDCLPLMVAALRRIGADEVLHEHRSWLEGEVRHYMDEVVDPATGLVRADRKYSAHRDTLVNRCNAFGNSMVALLAMTVVDLGWDIPEPMKPLALAPQSILLEHFWDARGFFRDAPGDDTPSGEGNVWPFWTGVITDPSVLRQALATLEDRGYAKPYPLKYEPMRRPQLEPWFVRTFMPDYQGATVWTSLGSMYMQLLHTIDPEQAQREMHRYVAWIERDGTFWEVIDDETGERLQLHDPHEERRVDALVGDLPRPAAAPGAAARDDAVSARSCRRAAVLASGCRGCMRGSERARYRRFSPARRSACGVQAVDRGRVRMSLASPWCSRVRRDDVSPTLRLAGYPSANPAMDRAVH